MPTVSTSKPIMDGLMWSILSGVYLFQEEQVPVNPTLWQIPSSIRQSRKAIVD
jgi:hypothetical protein